jgi:hypothetical protein
MTESHGAALRALRILSAHETSVLGHPREHGCDQLQQFHGLWSKQRASSRRCAAWAFHKLTTRR